jgi:hypothetical protein
LAVARPSSFVAPVMTSINPSTDDPRPHRQRRKRACSSSSNVRRDTGDRKQLVVQLTSALADMPPLALIAEQSAG